MLTLRMLDLFPHARGSVASVQSCISLVVASIVIGFIVPLVSHSMLELASAAFVLALLAFALWRSRSRAG